MVALPIVTHQPLAPRDAKSLAPVQRKGSGRLLPYQLGPYELFDHIGRGGMADIYRARLTVGFGGTRELVVKEVLPELREEARFSDLIIREAKLAAKLCHANIVRVEQLGREEGALYIAMEHVEGLDLRELLRRCAKKGVPLPVDMSLRICLDVLRALEYAHNYRFEGLRDAASGPLDQTPEPTQVGVVHRDVSPSNVLLSFDGEVKLCDFGIARAHDDPSKMQSFTMVEGKAGYMSPEQARGEALDGRADVFALGIILHELLSGRKLYRATKEHTLLDAARRANIPELKNSGLPFESEIRAILRKALARDKDDRYESASQMLLDLDCYVSKSKLVASSLRLGEWLMREFHPAIAEEQRRRELAVLALEKGSIARLEVVPSEADQGEADAELESGIVDSGGAKAKSGGLIQMTARGPNEDVPRSLEGTSSDISAPLQARRSRAALAIIATLLLIGVSIALYFALLKK